jgi:DNA-binding NarL/FixJ family response regulator
MGTEPLSVEPLSVLIVDDHPIFRKGLRTLLSALPSMTLAGEASSAREAVRMAEALQPDLVLMDLQMPDAEGDGKSSGGKSSSGESSGLTAIRQIVAASPHIRVLVVTMFEDNDSVFAAMRAGARGYILKDMDDEGMARAMVAVGNGEAIFSPAIATRVIAYFNARPPLPVELFPDLTESERAVLKLMAQGVNNDAIAQQLSFSSKTVRNYVSNIFSKLQVADRAQAIVKAREAGLG